LYGGVGADVLDGGADFDYARYDGAAARVTVDLSGVVLATGEAAGDSFISIEGLVGSAFADVLYGSAAADTLQGRGGDDTLRGGAGVDYLYGGAGADLLDGGTGSDYARYDLATAAITLDLSGLVTAAGEAVGDSLTSIENVIGSVHGDAIYGDAGINELQGGNGNDRLDGRGGADRLLGGAGNDDFVFKAGESNGDRISDFDGGGALALDELIFQGYGSGATFAQTSSTTWQISYASGSETLTFTNAASIHASDYTFI
jgi:Ca2+-binding RTX toxin-like protein